ncbi:MAG: DUF342 domain-containing protein, partial [Synergistaceae bacterium]|nr:DUF342 domain-containing protein [Synergistaceae bacterium]
MADVDLRLEAKEDGVWISASNGEFSKDDVYDVLKRHGVTKYELKALEQFVRAKTGEPFKIAPRDAANEKGAKIVVRMPADNMSASVLVEPPFFTKPWPTEEEILDALKARSIVFGIDHDAIKDIIERRYIDDYAVVAKGAPPIPGKDAQIELLIDPNKPPEIREDEKVDFWSRSTLVTVRVGQQVAVKHPAVAGKEGKTILGTTVKPQGVKDTDFSFGEGLAKDERDPLSLVAVADGQLTEQRGKLAVLPQLSIAGDIDFSVGSVDFTGAVDIKGSVREGFHVVAQGNVYVHGMIEGADVDSQGDITVNGGVRGMGKGTISAVGDVTIGFADQATIRSGGSIMVKNAILHSYLYAQKSVVVMGGGQKSQIAGGRIEAGLDVSCQVLGSEMGTKTEVIVGLPPAQL